MTPEQSIIISLLGTFALGLVSKIVYDWLKNRRDPEGTVSRWLLYEQEFETTKRDLITIDGKIGRLDSCLTHEKLKIVTLQANISDHEKGSNRAAKISSK